MGFLICVNHHVFIQAREVFLALGAPSSPDAAHLPSPRRPHRHTAAVVSLGVHAPPYLRHRVEHRMLGVLGRHQVLHCVPYIVIVAGFGLRCERVQRSHAHLHVEQAADTLLVFRQHLATVD